MRTVEQEIDKLLKAVDLFAQQMKQSLIKTAMQGKRGWDDQNDPKVTDGYLSRQLWIDASDLEQTLLLHPKVEKEADPLLVDIANRVAILWFRHQPDNHTSDPTP